MKRRMARLVLVMSWMAFASLSLCWLAAISLSFIEKRPRWVEPYVAWRAGPTQGYAVMATRSGVSLEARTLPWAPAQWPPARSVYDPSPRSAIERADGMTMHVLRAMDVSVLGFQRGRWDAVVSIGAQGGPIAGRFVSIPFWFLVLVFGFLPGRHAWRGIQAWRRQRMPG